MHTGDDGAAEAERVRQQRAQQDAESAKKPVNPFRFKLKHDVKDQNGRSTGRGETADIVILDVKPGPRFWEHTARNPRTGFWNQFEQCPREWDTCPLCPPEGEKSPYYVMMLTIIDMRVFTDSQGREWQASRKLLPVKIEQQGFFDDLYKQHGSLRGIHLITTRDGGQMSSPIGNNMTFECIHTEDEMEQFVKDAGLWEPYVQDNGRVIWGEGEFVTPFSYGKVFEKPSGAKLRAKYRAEETTGQSSGGGSHIGGNSDRQGDGWRKGTEPGRAPGGMNRVGSTRRVNLDDSGGVSTGGSASDDMNDEVPF